MAALQAQTKLSSSEPGVCPQDLRGAATANKTHKEPSPLALAFTLSAHYPALLPPRRGSSLFRTHVSGTIVTILASWVLIMTALILETSGNSRFWNPARSKPGSALFLWRSTPSICRVLQARSRLSGSAAPCHHPMSPDDIRGQLLLVLTTS